MTETGMRYLLNVESETYPIENIRISESVPSGSPEGKPFSFVSPVRLPIGKQCLLIGDREVYRLVVDGCFGFAYSLKFLVSGVIAGKQNTSN